MKQTTEELDGRAEYLAEREYNQETINANVAQWQADKKAAGDRFQRRIFAIVQFSGRFPIPSGEREKLQTIKRKISN